MEDLFPLLIFIVIAAVNAVKFFAEKGGRKAAPSAPEKEKPAGGASALEEFFEEIAQKFEPKPREVAQWPEGIERPDYVKEMTAFKTTPAPKTQPEQQPEPIPAVYPQPLRSQMKKQEITVPPTGKNASVKMPAQSTAFAGMSNVRMPMQPLLRSTAGRTTFELKNKQQLKQALLANMVFGPPRAYEQSFNNTMAQ
jgi:hypothetical protein